MRTYLVKVQLIVKADSEHDAEDLVYTRVCAPVVVPWFIEQTALLPGEGYERGTLLHYGSRVEELFTRRD